MSIMISTPLVIGPASIGTSELVDGAVTAAKIDSGAAADGQVLTADGAGGAAWEAAAGGGPGYLEYVAILTQSGTDAPAATVLNNTLGGEVVWTRANAGAYYGTLQSRFTADKTACIITFGGGAQFRAAGLKRYNDDSVSLLSYNLDNSMADGLFATYFVEIRVYP